MEEKGFFSKGKKEKNSTTTATTKEKNSLTQQVAVGPTRKHATQQRRKARGMLTNEPKKENKAKGERGRKDSARKAVRPPLSLSFSLSHQKRRAVRTGVIYAHVPSRSRFFYRKNQNPIKSNQSKEGRRRETEKVWCRGVFVICLVHGWPPKKWRKGGGKDSSEKKTKKKEERGSRERARESSFTRNRPESGGETKKKKEINTGRQKKERKRKGRGGGNVWKEGSQSSPIFHVVVVAVGS